METVIGGGQPGHGGREREILRGGRCPAGCRPLRIGVGHHDPSATSGELPGQVHGHGGLPWPPLLVDQGDDASGANGHKRSDGTNDAEGSNGLDEW